MFNHIVAQAEHHEANIQSILEGTVAKRNEMLAGEGFIEPRGIDADVKEVIDNLDAQFSTLEGHRLNLMKLLDAANMLNQDESLAEYVEKITELGDVSQLTEEQLKDAGLKLGLDPKQLAVVADSKTKFESLFNYMSAKRQEFKDNPILFRLDFDRQFGQESIQSAQTYLSFLTNLAQGNLQQLTKFEGEVESTKIDKKLKETGKTIDDTKKPVKNLGKELEKLRKKSLEFIKNLKQEIEVLKNANKEGVKGLEKQADEVLEIAEKERKLARQLGKSAERRLDTFTRLNESINLLVEKTALKLEKEYMRAYSTLIKEAQKLEITQSNAILAIQEEERKRFSTLADIADKTYNQQLALIEKQYKAEFETYKEMEAIVKKFGRSRRKSDIEAVRSAKARMAEIGNARVQLENKTQRIRTLGESRNRNIQKARLASEKKANAQLLNLAKSRMMSILDLENQLNSENLSSLEQVEKERTAKLKESYDALLSSSEKRKELLDSELLEEKKKIGDTEEFRKREQIIRDKYQRADTEALRMYREEIESLNAAYDRKRLKAESELTKEIMGIDSEGLKLLLESRERANAELEKQSVYYTYREDGIRKARLKMEKRSGDDLASVQKKYLDDYTTTALERNNRIKHLLTTEATEEEKLYKLKEGQLERHANNLVKEEEKYRELLEESAKLKRRMLFAETEEEKKQIKLLQSRQDRYIKTTISKMIQQSNALKRIREELASIKPVGAGLERYQLTEKIVDANAELYRLRVDGSKILDALDGNRIEANKDYLNSLLETDITQGILTKKQQDRLRSTLKDMELQTSALDKNLSIFRARIASLLTIEGKVEKKQIEKDLEDLKLKQKELSDESARLAKIENKTIKQQLRIEEIKKEGEVYKTTISQLSARLLKLKKKEQKLLREIESTGYTASLDDLQMFSSKVLTNEQQIAKIKYEYAQENLQIQRDLSFNLLIIFPLQERNLIKKRKNFLESSWNL